MATIKDVARQAGVSISTVSYALNGTRPISETTRRRILGAVKRLGYRPDARGRSLGAMRAGVVGVVAPLLTGYFVAPLLSGIELALRERGYRLLLTHMDQEDDFSLLFDKGQVDGLILLISESGEGDWLEQWTGRIERVGLPCLVVNRILPGVPCVQTHYRMGAVLAVRHLLCRGYRRIGFVGEDVEDPTQVALLEGYHQALRRAGIQAEPFWVAPHSQAAIERWTGVANRPMAVFVAGQYHTFPFYRLARERRLRIPQDMAVVGFDDDTNEADLWPALTTVAQSHATVGQAAVRLLIEILEGKPVQQEGRLVPPNLVIRDSCGGRLGDRS